MRFLECLKYFVFVLVLLSVSTVHGQDNPDSVFNTSKKLAEENKYNESIVLIKDLNTKYPDNLDYAIYLAQLYYWSTDYNSAKKQLQSILRSNTTNEDALKLLVKVEFMANNFSEVVSISEEGKKKFSDSGNYFDFQKALALEKLQQNKEALTLLHAIQKSYENKKELNYLKTEILKKQKNTISIGHLYTDFDNSFSASNITHVEYSRKLSKHTLVGRLLYGYQFGYKGLQSEIDAYLKGQNKNYLFLNIGYSDAQNVFPKYKLGSEYFQDFSNFNTSLGVRYLYFNSESEALLFTGHLAVDFNEWKIGYRHYLSKSESNWLSSSILYLRKSFDTAESYVQLDLQYGALPYYFFSSDGFQRLSAFRTGLQSKIRLTENYFIQPVFMYEKEEYQPEEYRNRYTIQFTVSKRF